MYFRDLARTNGHMLAQLDWQTIVKFKERMSFY